MGWFVYTVINVGDLIPMTHAGKKTNSEIDHSLEIAQYKKVLIVGLARTGKTTVTNKLKRSPHLQEYAFFHTDDYGDKHGHVPGLYVLIDDLKTLENPRWIVEGVMGIRLLRKIEQKDLSQLRPDLIVVVKTKRPPSKKHEFLSRGLKKIWSEYLNIRKVIIPALTIWC
jgi:GTPase SAR1 family protein